MRGKISLTLGISEAEAEDMLIAYEAAEDLFNAGSKQGSRTLSTQRAQRVDKDSQLNQDVKENPKKWRVDDVQPACIILDALVSNGRGLHDPLNLKDFITSVGGDDERFRPVVQRMKALNLLRVEPRKRRRETYQALFMPTKEFKARWKHEREAVIKELEALAEID